MSKEKRKKHLMILLSVIIALSVILLILHFGSYNNIAFSNDATKTSYSLKSVTPTGSIYTFDAQYNAMLPTGCGHSCPITFYISGNSVDETAQYVEGINEVTYFPGEFSVDITGIVDYQSDNERFVPVTINNTNILCKAKRYNTLDEEIVVCQGSADVYFAEGLGGHIFGLTNVRGEVEILNNGVECSKDYHCSDYKECVDYKCQYGTLITYYRYNPETNKCTSVSIPEQLKTENDYVTLKQCKEQIENKIPMYVYLVIFFVVGGVIIFFIANKISKGK